MQKIGNFLKIIFFVCLFQSSYAWGKVDVSSTVASDEVALNEPFEFVVQVTTDEDVEVGEPRFDQIEGFQITNQGRSESSVHRLGQTSSGMQFSVQRTVSFRYQLVATALGRKTIPSVELVLNGKTYRTQPILMNVLEVSNRRNQRQAPQQQRQRSQLPGFDDFENEEDLFEQLLQQRQRLLQNFARQNPGLGGGFQNAPSEPLFDPELRTLPKNANEAFFVQVEVDKLQAYEGEQVTVAWAIYTRGSMESLDRVKFPNLRGFWKEIIEEVPALQFEEEIVNGIPYRRALLAAHALFPIKSGTSTIDEFKIKARVRTFNQGWNQKANEYTKSSEAVSIKVKPLPLEGRPPEFTGAVGDFEIRASIDKPQITANQPFSLRIRIEGKGNAKIIELPNIELPQEIERYDSKSETRFFKNGTSYKEFELLLIPRKSGEIEIPAFKLGFFDSQKSVYYLKETEPLKITIAEGAPGEDNAVRGTQLNQEQKKTSVAETGPVIRSSMKSSLASSLMRHPQIEVLSLLVLLGYFLGRVGFVIWGGEKRVHLKAKTLSKLKSVQKFIQSKDPRKVGSEMLNLVFEVVSEASGLDSSSLKVTELVDNLPLSFKTKYGERLTQRLRVFEEMTFAPDVVVDTYKSADRLKTEVEETKKFLLELISTYHQEE